LISYADDQEASAGRKRIPSGWETASDITPELHLVCDRETAIVIADTVEQGLPLNVALDLAGVPRDVFDDWRTRAANKETPYIWALTLITKARANYLYNMLIDLNLADEKMWRKYMEILKLRDAQNWSATADDEGTEAIDPEFM